MAKKTKAWRCWLNYSKSASENDRRWNQTQGSQVPNQWAFPSISMDLKCSKNRLETGSTGLWKGLGIHKFNTSSRRFLRSSKCRKCCFTSHGLLELRHIWPLSRQLVTTFRDLAEMRDGWRPYSHTNILPSMWYVSMKASLIANSTRNTNIYQRADRH